MPSFGLPVSQVNIRKSRQDESCDILVDRYTVLRNKNQVKIRYYQEKHFRKANKQEAALLHRSQVLTLCIIYIFILILMQNATK